MSKYSLIESGNSTLQGCMAKAIVARAMAGPRNITKQKLKRINNFSNNMSVSISEYCHIRGNVRPYLRYPNTIVVIR